MKRLLILILAIVVLAAPIPALAMKTMCVDSMPKMAAMDHDMAKGSCCDDEHKTCLQACEATLAVTLAAPLGLPDYRVVEPEMLPSTSLARMTIATIADGLDRPPRPIV
ncbi:MAG: hypothetical protein K2W81_14555 [Sphingomonas sp.]|uniref:hypothetical protein n=1 Tax=Sphingomonas sp. TaxID=28214 RepID=UPI0025CBF2C2|nr:hypothetical protein [Sphingomonas sp.]MBY0285171.1 hypothetical protein [Sphingomonas sp.]